MPSSINTLPIASLFNEARIIEQKIIAAIDENNDSQTDLLSAEYEKYVEAILSFSTTTLSDLKYKCAFSQNYIAPGHDDPETVINIFSKINQDIELLSERYSPKAS